MPLLLGVRPLATRACSHLFAHDVTPRFSWLLRGGTVMWLQGGAVRESIPRIFLVYVPQHFFLCKSPANYRVTAPCQPTKVGHFTALVGVERELRHLPLVDEHGDTLPIRYAGRHSSRDWGRTFVFLCRSSPGGELKEGGGKQVISRTTIPPGGSYVFRRILVCVGEGGSRRRSGTISTIASSRRLLLRSERCGPGCVLSLPFHTPHSPRTLHGDEPRYSNLYPSQSNRMHLATRTCTTHRYGISTATLAHPDPEGEAIGEYMVTTPYYTEEGTRVTHGFGNAAVGASSRSLTRRAWADR